MKILVKNSSLKFYRPSESNIDETKRYVGYIANFYNSNVMEERAAFRVSFFKIPEGAISFKFTGRVFTSYGVSLVKGVTLGDSIATYTNVARNIIIAATNTDEDRNKENVEVSLESYSDAEYIMVSWDSVEPTTIAVFA